MAEIEKIYRDYKDIAAFRMVYINEAHPIGSSRPSRQAYDKGITEHKDYSDRRSIAEMLIQDQLLSIPAVIDTMDNKVNEAYKAWPDRVFVVRKDGRLAVAANRGPWGFIPALKEVKKWLSQYKKTGQEPDLPQKR